MDFDFKPYFDKYKALVDQVDGAFKIVEGQHPECVRCKLECSDCCHAIFDLTLIEALYINHYFAENLSPEKKNIILDRANVADRKAAKLKRQAQKALREGKKDEQQILYELSLERIKCPLLSDGNLCELYDYRPITCRLYGIPTSIAGKGHTCGISEFKEGEKYPTVNLDPIQSRLYQLSNEIVAALKTKYVRMGEMLVPLSMAILTVYDKSYLGLEEPEDKKEER